VALVMTNSPLYVELLYAVWWEGLTAVPINAKLHREEAAYILEHSGAKVCFVTADLESDIGGLEGRCGQLMRVITAGSDAYAELLREAGTAEPHGRRATMSPGSFTPAARPAVQGRDDQPPQHRDDDAVLLCRCRCDPSGRQRAACGADVARLRPVQLSARAVRGESDRSGAGPFRSTEVFALCRSFKGVALFAAPTMVNRLIGHARSHSPDLHGLKSIIYGGGPMYLEDIKQALEVIGERLVQIYGQGECPMAITALSREHIAAAHIRAGKRDSAQWA
jgi:long-chain acyl-CoA synthetase